jgi:hypothetical protein
MFRRGEEVGVRGNRERGEDGEEEETRIQNLYLRRQLSLCEEMSRLFNGRWLFIVRSRFRLALLEVN